MELWLANGLYGLNFEVEGRYHGGAALFGDLFPWRRKMYKAGMEAAQSPWVRKI